MPHEIWSPFSHTRLNPILQKSVTAHSGTIDKNMFTIHAEQNKNTCCVSSLQSSLLDDMGSPNIELPQQTTLTVRYTYPCDRHMRYIDGIHGLDPKMSHLDVIHEGHTQMLHIDVIR